MAHERPAVGDLCSIIQKSRKSCSNVVVSYHGVNLERYAYYCGPADLVSTIYVSPGDCVSICQESMNPNPKMGDSHIVGHFSGDLPVVDSIEKISRWSKVKSCEQCQDCIALYFCAGGCRAKMVFTESGLLQDDESLYWCDMTRKLAVIEIIDCPFDSRLYPNSERFCLDNLSLSKRTVSVVKINS